MSIVQAIRIFFFYLLLGTSALLWCSAELFRRAFSAIQAFVIASSTCIGVVARLWLTKSAAQHQGTNVTGARKTYRRRLA
jgi:hypothetical protein